MGLSPQSFKFNYITVSLIILVTRLVEPSKCTQVIREYKTPGLYITYPDLIASFLKRGKPTPYLWLVPQLGHKKRDQQVDQEGVHEYRPDNEDINDITMWSSVSDETRKVEYSNQDPSTFKPRLGRDLNEKEFHLIYTPRMGKRHSLVPKLDREYTIEILK